VRISPEFIAVSGNCTFFRSVLSVKLNPPAPPPC
jgi:hypothetical protein